MAVIVTLAPTVRPRNRIVIALLLSAIVTLAMTCANAAPPIAAIEIQTEDVDRFYSVFDGAGGRPTAEQIQRDYIDKGTAGLHHLTRVRNVTAEGIARAVLTQPELYTSARSCLAALPHIRSRIARVFANLLDLYPGAARLPVTVLISRGKPLAIAGPDNGVQVALEAMCSQTAAEYLGANLDNRFVQVTAHEYIHVQQPQEGETPTVLERALHEGVAEFLGELISGGVANVAVHASAKGHEREIETAFAADLEKTDLSAWFDNTTAEDVGQLGYWVGYRIAKSYYRKARDQRAAIAKMILNTDAHAFLAQSDWKPGIVLDEVAEMRGVA